MHLDKQNNTLRLRAGVAALVVAAVLFVSKAVTVYFSGSVSVKASALDSLLDFFSSAINLLAITAASIPPDHDHRYGHGKAEALAGLFQGILISFSSAYLVYETLHSLFIPKTIEYDYVAIAVMVLSLVLTAALVVYQQYVVRRTNSIVVTADSLHYFSDLLGNSVVIISLLLSRFTGFVLFDSVGALLVAAYILKSSYEIFVQSFDILTDKDISDQFRPLIDNTLNSYKGDVFGYHDLRSRTTGFANYMEFHLELRCDMTLKESHEIVEKIARDLKKHKENLEVIIHSDPVEILPTGQKILLDQQSPRFF